MEVRMVSEEGRCLDEEIANLYVRGELAEEDQAEVKGHLSGCVSCERLIIATLPTGTDAGAIVHKHFSATTLTGTGSENPSAPVTRVFRRGMILAEKYRVERVLGVGGMGRVLEVRHIELQQRFAVKVMREDLRGAGILEERFLREARAAAKLAGKHTARIFDVGHLESGTPYMVMEFLDGEDLEALTESRGPLPVGEAVGYLLQACEGVAEAHANQIVHRDLKPSNLFLARGPRGKIIKVLDFGIAKTFSESSGPLNLTRSSIVMGSPLYMSPEQLQASRDVDMRTDIWALGATLYHLLAGRPPFEAENGQLLSARILLERAAPLRACRGDVPPELDAVVMRCLERDVARRFPDVDALARALLPFRHISARVALVAEPTASENNFGTAVERVRERPEASFLQNRMARLVALAAVVGVLGLVVLVALTAPRAPTETRAGAVSAAVDTPSTAISPSAAVSAPAHVASSAPSSAAPTPTSHASAKAGHRLSPAVGSPPGSSRRPSIYDTP